MFRPDGMSKYSTAEVPDYRGRLEELAGIHAPHEGRPPGKDQVRQNSPLRW